MSEGALELTVTRTIAAPPEKVWNVLVNRQEEWWCPKPWRAVIDRQDRRPGGACDMTFHGPDGETMRRTASTSPMTRAAASSPPTR